jgi:multidrug resistance efflux pump
MPAIFSRTLRSLESDGAQWRWVAPCLLVVFAAWGAWFIFAKVTVYEVSRQARLEARNAVHPIVAAGSGRVAQNHLILGSTVKAGDVLARLESESEHLATQEGHERVKALASKLEALQNEVRVSEVALTHQSAARTRSIDALRTVIREQHEILASSGKARADALDEARARIVAAEARAKAAEVQAESFEILHKNNAASEAEYRRYKAESEAARAEVKAMTLAAGKLEKDRLVDESDRRMRIETLEREGADLEQLRIVEESDRRSRLANLASQIIDLQGAIAVQMAALKRLEYDASERVVRAPATGRIAEVEALEAGSFVSPGIRLGSIVCQDALHAVGMFSSRALGRIAPGQQARLRLDGFPSTQFGSVSATVARVANEPLDGLIRVEFALDLDSTLPVAIEHGLTGSIEVELERVSPAVLVLRAAGYFFQRTASADAVGTSR